MVHVLTDTLAHLLNNVIPAARDYEQAEDELTRAVARDADPSTWVEEAQRAKRRAAEVAIAIDGLADRAASALGLTPDEVRTQVGHRCVIGGIRRLGCVDRVCAVANAYKHAGPLRAKHPIDSEADVLATGAGYGIDGYGIGKFSGVEVLVNQKDGTTRKFLGDVPWSIAGWFGFLADHGAPAPTPGCIVCGLQVNAGSAAQSALRSAP
jgi:hypothetical protein